MFAAGVSDFLATYSTYVGEGKNTLLERNDIFNRCVVF